MRAVEIAVGCIFTPGAGEHAHARATGRDDEVDEITFKGAALEGV